MVDQGGQRVNDARARVAWALAVGGGWRVGWRWRGWRALCNLAWWVWVELVMSHHVTEMILQEMMMATAPKILTCPCILLLLP